ncbi:MAG: hypothetical protein H7282_09505 [Cytophagaceae bacterium]|nr:hypothetical protein [Cytophagaceae bacterium]
MNLKNIASLHLQSQQLAGTTFKKTEDLVQWMGVLQAQDYSMCLAPKSPKEELIMNFLSTGILSLRNNG